MQNARNILRLLRWGFLHRLRFNLLRPSTILVVLLALFETFDLIVACCLLFGNLLADLQRNVLSECLNFVGLLLNLIFKLDNLIVEFLPDFLTNARFHNVVVIFESLELACAYIQLVDHLITLGEHFGVCERFYVLKQLFAFLAVVLILHLLNVNNVVVLMLT